VEGVEVDFGGGSPRNVTITCTEKKPFKVKRKCWGDVGKSMLRKSIKNNEMIERNKQLGKERVKRGLAPKHTGRGLRKTKIVPGSHSKNKEKALRREH